MNNLTFREYQNNDAPYLEDIIRKTWQYDLFCSKEVSRKMAKLYLLGCLCHQTFAQVALIDNKPIGVIMCENKNMHKVPFPIKIMQIKATISLFLSREGRAVGRIFKSIDGVDKELLQTQSKTYYGELVFFAVCEESRGNGVGKALFQNALNYMKTQKIDDFYLYTDSSCNFKFYERQGMKRVDEKIYSVPMKTKNEMKFYLYEYLCTNNAKYSNLT